MNTRIEELGAVIVESQTALENERSEVETLRQDATSASSITLADEAKRAQRQIVTLKTERAMAIKDLGVARRETDETSQHVEQLRQDLRAAEKEIDRHHRERAGSLESDKVLSVHRQAIDSRDEEIKSLKSRLHYMNNPTPNVTMPTNQDLPQNRLIDRSTSSSSLSGTAIQNGSANRRSVIGKDDIGSLKEQIVGLKVIIVSMGEENADLIKNNKALTIESQEMR